MTQRFLVFNAAREIEEKRTECVEWKVVRSLIVSL